MNWDKRILHLGLGRFHRGHQAVYYQCLADQGDFRWGVVSLSMRSVFARDEIREAEFKYPVLALGKDEKNIRWISAIQESYSGFSDLSDVKMCFTRRELEIITLTITEKGYCLNPQGNLDLTHKSIQHDQDYPHHPLSAIGILARGLKLRMEAQLGGVTILSCDNLRENSLKLKLALQAFLTELKLPHVAAWIEKNCSFPCSMVDRIVPSFTEEKLKDLSKEFDLPSEHLIATEVFSQWVIEDKFVFERPPLDTVGAEYVIDVKPFEEIKLRILNASHSYLAYEGLNRGYQFVHEAIQDKELLAMVKEIHLDVIPTIKIPSTFDIKLYTEKLLWRFQNRRLPHRLVQIAMDGSLKMPERIFPSLKIFPTQVLNQVVASWLDYCWTAKDLTDPKAEQLQSGREYGKNTWAKLLLNSDIFQGIDPKPILTLLRNQE